MDMDGLGGKDIINFPCMGGHGEETERIDSACIVKEIEIDEPD